jgi:RHS repeat-associated protein
MIYFASDLWILGGLDKLPDMPQPVALEYPILRLTRNGNAMKLPTIVVSLALGLPLLMIATAPRALALASSESAANPWMFAPTVWFSSPAEAAEYQIANEDPSYPVYLVNITGPYTTEYDSVPCSTANPCYTPNLRYYTINSGYGVLIQYLGSAPFGQVCADGSYVPSGQACAGESLGAPGCHCAGSVSRGNPIDVGSGNKFEEAVDYETAGQNKLRFVRYYNSRSSYTTLATTLGMFWRSNYDRYIRINSSTSVIAERADGQQLVFTLVGSVWTPNSDVDITLTNSGSAWTLTDHDDTVETYTTNTIGTAGVLNTIQARNGYTQTLTYTGAQLTSVVDSYLRSLSLGYNSGLLSAVTTPEGTALGYGYTTGGYGSNLTSVIYPTSPSTTLTYLYDNTTLPNALTGIVDENGNSYATWTYDSSGRGLTSQHGNGADLTTVTYNDTTGGRTVTNALGVTDTYTFATLQGVPKVTQISRTATSTTAAATETFGYDGNGYPASATDWNGNLTTYVNDMHGDPTNITEAVGSSVARSTAIAYDPIWVHLPDTIVTPELTTSYAYDGNGNPLTKTLTDTTTTTSPYATGGQARTSNYTWANFLLASAKTPNGDLTQYGYDGTGALTSTTNPLNQVTQIANHTGGGYPLTIVDPNSVTTTLTYSPRLWLLTGATSAASQPSFTTTWRYDAAGNLASLTLPDNSKLTYGYDTAHRLIKVTDLFGNNTAYTLDGLGDMTLTNVSNPKGTVTRTHSGVFDALGRILQDIGGMGQTTTYTYDPDGNALTIADPDNNQTQQSFDALNRVSTITYPAPGGFAAIAYDPHDRVLTVTDPNSNVTSYVYDGFGDAIQQTSPDTATTVYVYDADGNLTRKTDAAGAIANNTFDALDRVLTTTYPGDASENIAYTYDQAVHGFGIGRLTSLTDAVGSLSRGYDERGNMLTESRTNGKTSMKTFYTYDAANRVASIGYPSTAAVVYTRDIMGRIVRVSAKAPGVATYSSVASAIAYEPFGPVSALTFGNGIADTRGYDLDYRMTGIADTGTTDVQKVAYAYDPANNVMDIEDKVNASNSQAFKYDPLNRLTQATSATGGYGKLVWTYDPVGNRLTQTAKGVLTTYGYTAGSNRLASIATGATTQSVGTTSAGNIDSFSPAMNSVTSLAYNQASRLATLTAGTKLLAKYTYDAFGQRLRKATTTTTATLYQFGQSGNLLEEAYTSGAGPVDYIYLGTQPVATLTPGTGTFSYLHTDHLGTPQLATSNTQAVVWSAGGYQPFGATETVTGTITQNLRFPGQYFDAESAFNHNGFRDYMPNIGRYLESDPVGLTGGINTYLYARANPLKNMDRLGLVGGDVACSSLDKQLDSALSVSASITDLLASLSGISGFGLARELLEPLSQDLDLIGVGATISEGNFAGAVGTDLTAELRALSFYVLFQGTATSLEVAAPAFETIAWLGATPIGAIALVGAAAVVSAYGAYKFGEFAQPYVTDWVTANAHSAADTILDIPWIGPRLTAWLAP